MKYLPKGPKKAPHPAKLRGHGAAGEAKVKSYISRLVINEPNMKRIDNLILIDGNGGSHQVDHVLIRSNGVFVIETKNWGGLVLGNKDEQYWIQIVGKTTNTLLNPLIQNKTHCREVNRVIGDEYHVQSLIVMTQNNAKKIGADNVINLYHIGKYINDHNSGEYLSPEDISLIYERLMNSKSDMSLEEHIKNMKK